MTDESGAALQPMPRMKVGNMTAATSPPGNRVLRRRILVRASVIAIGILGVAIVLSLNWPFTQAAVTKALQDRFVRDVRIRNFRKTFSLLAAWPKELRFCIAGARICRRSSPFNS